MIIDKKESAIFITFLKEALVEEIRLKGGNDQDIDFINESSDANVLSLIAFGKIADEQDQTIVKEEALKCIKQTIIENNDLFGISTNDFLYEFDSSIGNIEDESYEVLSESWFDKPVVNNTPPVRKLINKAHDMYFEKFKDFKAWLHDNIGAQGGELAKSVISMTVLVAGISYFAYKTYKRYLSKSGKQCRNMSGSVKSKCIRQAELIALKNQVTEIKKNMANCSKTTNPEKCKKTLSNKIKKIEDKISARKSVDK